MNCCSILPRLAVCLAFLSHEAQALTVFADANAPVRSHTFVCEIVRAYVAQHGEAAAERWARRNKWSREKITEARSCLGR